MQTFSLRDHFDPDYGEWIIGTNQTGRHGVYLTVGELEEGQARALDLGGHEEILLLLSGAAELQVGEQTTALQAEHAAYLPQGTKATLRARSGCRYVCAGGHPSAHGH